MFGSRTKNQSQFERITDKVYSWRSSEQKFFYYDKEASKRVALPDGAKLIPLTFTNSVTGVHSVDLNKATKRHNPIYSNEFTDYKNEIVRVKEYDRLDGTKTTLFEGVYSPTIRDAIASVPHCKFTKNIYCLLNDEVVKLELKASSLRPWIEFEDSLKKTQTYLTDGHCIMIGEAEKQTMGTVDYYSPTFKLGDITLEENDRADQIAEEVEAKIAHNKSAVNGDNEIAAQIPQEQDSSDDEKTEEVSLDAVPF